MKKLSKATLTALLLTGTVLSAHAASARPMTPEDLATLKRVGSPAVSPDERWTAFQVTETDAESYERETALYLLDLTQPKIAPMRIADRPKASEHSPAFSADGKAIYFISDEDEREHLWRYDRDSKTTTNLTEVFQGGDVAGFKLSADGKKIAIWGDTAKSCENYGCGDDTIRSEPGPGTGREYSSDDGFVRHWSSWEMPGNYSRIFTFELDDEGLRAGVPADGGTVIGDSPSKPFGAGEEIAWSADSQALYFTLRKADKNEPKSTNLDIYRHNHAIGYAKDDPAARPENLTAANQATDTLPSASPNGRWLAYAAMKRPGYEADKLSVILKDLKSGVTRDLTKDWDRSVGSIAWTPDSKKLIVTAQEILDHPAFEIDVETGKVKRLTGEGNVGDVIPMKDGSIIYTLNTLQSPTEIYRKAPASAAVQLTNMNGTELAAIDKVSIQRFDFKGAGGAQVWGQIIKPAGATGKLPMAFLVHGGPQGSFGNSWSTRWNPKVMASQGYAVVTIDFHGSTGYGQEFTDSINQDWGGKPLEDLKLGYDAVLKIDSQIDGTRSCALGASYGGYMMNWISGNWPDRFDCIINHAGVFDLRAMALTTEELWFDQWDHGGTWTKRPNPEKWNPVNHIEKWKTPTLVIHGEKDFRIPYTQSLMAFNVLQENEVPAKLLIFPDENHWVLKGKNSIQWHRAVFDWMNKWTSADNPQEVSDK